MKAAAFLPFPLCLSYPPIGVVAERATTRLVRSKTVFTHYQLLNVKIGSLRLQTLCAVLPLTLNGKGDLSASIDMQLAKMATPGHPVCTVRTHVAGGRGRPLPIRQCLSGLPCLSSPSSSHPPSSAPWAIGTHLQCVRVSKRPMQKSDFLYGPALVSKFTSW